jgi:hypothetical protein
MRSIALVVRCLTDGTGLLLARTLESLYARCQSQALRAIHPDAGGFARPGLGPI